MAPEPEAEEKGDLAETAKEAGLEEEPIEAKEKEAEKDNPKKVADPLEGLRQELKKAEEESLYLSAELQNFRKRMEKEKAEFLKYGHEDFIRNLLFVQDNFERALSYASSQEEGDKKSQETQVLKGLEMIMIQFSEVLKEQGVHSIESVGKKFDPNFHEAVAEEDSEDKESGTIILEHSKGYLLHDRVLRASRVTVVKGKAAGDKKKD